MPINVEIFHDSNRPKQPTKEVYEGLDKIESIIGRLSILGESRKLKIANNNEPILLADNIRWPRIPANLSIVLTDRTIIANGKEAQGISLQGRDIIVVNTNIPELTPTTTAHEFGHFLEILEKYDDRHCPLPDCIMHRIFRSTSSREDQSFFNKANRVSRILFGWDLEKRTVEYDSSFCDSCRSEIAESTHRMMARMALKTMRNFSK